MHGSSEGVREVHVDEGLEYGVFDHDLVRAMDDVEVEEDTLAYGDNVVDEKADASSVRGLVDAGNGFKKDMTGMGAGTSRFVEIEYVEAGPEISTDDDSGTVTDDYDADSSEAELPSGPVFNRSRYGEVTGGLSEISLWDTAICVGFGYALVYSS